MNDPKDVLCKALKSITVRVTHFYEINKIAEEMENSVDKTDLVTFRKKANITRSKNLEKLLSDITDASE